MDEIYEVRYKGLRISKYKANPKGEESYELLLLVSITGPEYRVRHGLDVGAPFGRVKQVLGAPSAEKPGNLQYENPESNTTVEFQETGGKISRIEWTFQPD